jgi:hypothetical protein
MIFNPNIHEDEKSLFYNIYPINIENETQVLLKIQKMTIDYLSMYPTTKEEDLKLLETELSQNIRNCVLMRLGEKSVLMYYLELTKYSLSLIEINNIKEIKKKVKKDFANKTNPYEHYINEVLLNLIRKDHINKS